MKEKVKSGLANSGKKKKKNIKKHHDNDDNGKNLAGGWVGGEGVFRSRNDKQKDDERASPCLFHLFQ